VYVGGQYNNLKPFHVASLIRESFLVLDFITSYTWRLLNKFTMFDDSIINFLIPSSTFLNLGS
jgi:hypothetical protein